MAMRLLLVEDKDSFRRLLVQALEGSAWATTAVADPGKALELLESEPFDVLVTDLRLPGFSGLELLKKAKRARPALRAVLMSAFGEPKDIVEAMRAGADDFLPKPFDLDLFLALLDRLRALVGAPSPDPREPWVARAPAMAVVEQQLRRIAEVALPVLFTGGRGAGKARAARRLHVLGRPGAPFAARPAAALLEEAAAAELLRLLQGGSLYLSGLEELDDASGSVLARRMESPAGQGLRWMAGADPRSVLSGSAGRVFAALRLVLPSLSERREDLLPLFQAYVALAAHSDGRIPPDLDKVVERQILERPWPGNVRELAACAARTLRQSEGLVLRRLAAEEGRSGFAVGWPKPGTLDSMLRETGREAERALLRRAMEEAGGEPAAAAAALGLTVRALGLRLREHGLPLEG